MLQDCDWDRFVESYLEPNRRFIEAYYRNFVTDGTGSWNECVEMYCRRWFEEAEYREQVLYRLRGFDFRGHAQHCMTQIEPVLPGAISVDVIILLGLGTSNAFQLLMDGRPVVRRDLHLSSWEGDHGYAETADEMMELARQQAGFLGVESVRDSSGVGITVSYWESEEAIQRWREHARHRTAQRLGREMWYEHYAVRVCKVERAYIFAREER